MKMVLFVGGSSSPASYDVVVHFRENYFSVIIMSVISVCMYIRTPCSFRMLGW
jgi:hypothetical protein